MKLLRLEIQGFKSFKDRTLIHFDDGITGIVGPNGCGKSNIVDALFWVMGEQSAKHLRGTKMKDLIFAGSSKYSPANWAEVTLVLLNDTGKHIHIGSEISKPNEIALTRKLYRNGETEYRINNLPARLKDIQEVFMDTGAGAKSYSIIAQGEINKLVQAKPQERMMMIEEVAGVTKFKLRKKESLKKIENTQANLNRLEDLQSEIYKNLKSLEAQAHKAELAKEYKSKAIRHELIVKSHQEIDLLSELRELYLKIQKSTSRIDELKVVINQAELELEDDKIKKDDLVGSVDALQAQYNELARDLSAKEERLKHLKKSSEQKVQRTLELDKENQELVIDIENRKIKLAEIELKISDLENTDFDNEVLIEMQAHVEELKEELEVKVEELENYSYQINGLKEELNGLKSQEFQEQAMLKNHAKTLEETNAEIEQIEIQFADNSENLKKQKEEVSILKEKVSSLDSQKTLLKNKVKENELLLAELQKVIKEKSKILITKQSKLESLKEIATLDSSFKGGESFCHYIKNKDDSRAIVLLADSLESKAEFTKSLEKVMAHYFPMVMAKNSEGDMQNWISQNPNSSLSFLKVNSQSTHYSNDVIERFKLKGLEEITPAIDVVKIKNVDFKHEIEALLSGVYIAKVFTKEMALKIADDFSFKAIVSMSGEVMVIKDPQTMQIHWIAEGHKSMGPIERNNLMESLVQDVSLLESELSLEEKSLVDLEIEFKENKIHLSKINDEFMTVQTRYISLKSSLDSRENGFGSSSARLKILADKKISLSNERLSLMENEEKLAQQISLVIEKTDYLSERYHELKEVVDELKLTYEQKRSEWLEKKALASSFQGQLDSWNSQKQDLIAQIEKWILKREFNIELLETMSGEIQEIQNQCEELQNENYSQVQELSNRQETLDIMKDELTQLMLGMQQFEDKVKVSNKELSELDKKIVEHELRYKQILNEEELIAKDCFERFRIDLRKVAFDYLGVVVLEGDSSGHFFEDLSNLASIKMRSTEFGEEVIASEDYEFEKLSPYQVKESKEKWKKFTTDLQKLGEVNWQADIDYQKQKMRYDFLKVQENELKASMEELSQAISHIDEKSKTRFKLAFDEVNERFTKVFPIIFGGGEARLELVGNLDDAECGVDIVAKPPGKKMQSINLMSGGEKAMTAVSLIFSIFLVKPSPFCLLDEVDAPLDDANVGRFNELLREMSSESQFILITHNKKTMELNDTLYGVTMQEPGVSKAVSVQLH